MDLAKRTQLLEHFACPITKSALTLSGDSLVSAEGRRYPIKNGVPRFAGCNAASKSCGFLPKKIASSHRDHQFVEWRFTSVTGLTPREVEGKLVLDVGQGSGQYSEVLAHWGANVIGMDISEVVDSAAKNLGAFDNVVIAQADLNNLPFQEGMFDFIIATDTLNHTSTPQTAFSALIPFLKKGGSIALSVPDNSITNQNRATWSRFTSIIPPSLFYTWCEWFISLTHRHKASDTVRWIEQVFPFANRSVGITQDTMETFQQFSAKYNFCFSDIVVKDWFKKSGLQITYVSSESPLSLRGVKS